MVIADTGGVGGLFGSIFDQNRWCITSFATIAAIVWATNNVIQPQTGHVAEDNDDESDEEEEEELDIDPLVAMEEAAPVASTAAGGAGQPRRQHSIAHQDIIDGKIVFFDVDVECINDDDLIQLSCVISNANGDIIDVFDRFIKPPDDAPWLHEACKSHKYEKEDPRIMNAERIQSVWKAFVDTVESHLEEGNKVGMIRGWNGKGCEMTKFFKICEVNYRGLLHMPRWVKYFCDPQKCISNYKKCRLHESKRTSQRVGYGLGAVYAEAFGQNFEEHNSLEDAKAQQKICNDDNVKKNALDKVESVELIDNVWRGKQASRAMAGEESRRVLPIGWADSPTTEYPIPRNLAYTGANGGGVCGPSSTVTEACNNRNLADLFLYFFTDEMLKMVADEMNRYGNGTFVRVVTKEEWRSQSNNAGVNDPIDGMESPVEISDEEDGEEEEDDEEVDNETGLFQYERFMYGDSGYNSGEDSDYETEEEDEEDEEEETKNRRTYFVECKPDHPQARKRTLDEWIHVTPGMLLVFFGIMIINTGALANRYWNIPWMECCGINIPFIQNLMTRDAFQQCKRFLHFVNNKELDPDASKSPLRKIQPFIDKALDRFRMGYVMGQYISLDESMIKYKGKQVQFVQYMPNKPIKHGIKVFAICCAETGYIYGFYVYTGKQNDPHGSPKRILKRLLDQDPSFLTSSAGRIVFMDNYYTSEEVMAMLFNDYSMFTVGTVRMTKKKSRTVLDFAFHKLSNAAKAIVGKGWTRWAQKTVGPYIVQCTTWMDNKQVGILHNIYVGGPGEFTTYRYDKDARKKVEVKCHPIIPFYVKWMRGVDMIDRSMADWIVSMKSNKFYYRIFWYVFTAMLVEERQEGTHRGSCQRSSQSWAEENRDIPERSYGL